MRRILAVLIENEAGALSRVVGLFSQRNFNIESLTVAPTEDATLSRITITTAADTGTTEQIIKQLYKLVEVVKVMDLGEGDHLERELMLVKVRTDETSRQELKRTADIFRGQIVDRGTPYDISSLRQISSSGVMWSQETKKGLLEHHDMALIDIMGSTEGGMGSSVTTREGASATAKFEMNDGVKVISDDGLEVAAGSGTIGRLATSAFVPLGYYKDEEKSAATFQEIDGVRYSFPGDYATVEADGTIALLGRGSACINTGGEKGFPEEVEEAVKRHPSVLDCLVVGLPSERFGESVTAVVSLRDYTKATVDDLMATAKQQLAGYKAPKAICIVEVVKRAPNGKADYKWARAEAEKQTKSEATA